MESSFALPGFYPSVEPRSTRRAAGVLSDQPLPRIVGSRNPSAPADWGLAPGRKTAHRLPCLFARAVPRRSPPSALA